MCYFLLIAMLFLAGCIPTTMMPQTSTQSPIAPASTVRAEPTQLATHQIEVRRLEVPYDLAYRAATQAMFSLGYSIEHSDKASGILTGSRMVGVTAHREEIAWKRQETKQKLEKAEQMDSASWLPYVGWLYTLEAQKLRKSLPDLEDTPEPKCLQITMYLKPLDEKSAEIRFKMLVDGEPAWDPIVIDKLWVTTEREAMIEEGPSPRVTTGAESAPQPSASFEAKVSQPAGAEVAQTAAPPEAVYVKDSTASLLQEPGPPFQQLAVLQKGTKLTVLGLHDQWYRVRTEDGKEGLVASWMVSPQP